MAEEVTLESPAGGRVVVSDPGAVNTLIYGSGYRRVDADPAEPTAEPATTPAAESPVSAAPAEPARTADTGARAAKPATEK